MTPMTSSARSILSAALTGALLAACGGSGGGVTGDAINTLVAQRTPASALKLVASGDCADWRAYAADSFVAQALSPVYAAASGGGNAGGIPAADGAAAPEFTDTNTQEAGVDEADLIETDTDRGLLYVVHRATASVRIIDAVPAANTREVGRINLGDEQSIVGLYLDRANQRLAVVSTGFGEGRGVTHADFYSVAVAAAPMRIGQYRVDGYPISSRRIGSRVHLVASHYFRGLDGLYGNNAFTNRVTAWFDAQGEGDTARAESLRDELVALARQAADDADIATLVPNTASGVAADLAPMDCDALFHPEVDSVMATVTISSVDTNGANAATIGTVNNAWMVYGSADNLYLAQTSGGWFFSPFQVDQTAIYRFEISDTGPAVPRGAGAVEGWLLNSYAMSEFDGHLRVATSRLDACRSVNPQQACPDDGGIRTNDVAVLRLDDDALTPVGRVTGFGNDERIFSARFMGDVGYVVTFRQIDPLFTFDLSDPTDPTVLGDVEIPGFSSYIHPLSDDVLLTIGRAGGEGGVGVGNAFQLQLFDVSDLTNPTRIAASTPAIDPDDHAYSVAEHEPLAFTYAPDADATTGLLSVPAQIGSPSESRAFSGFITWRVDTAGVLTEDLRIDHKQTGNGGGGCPPNAGGTACSDFAPVIYNAPLRSAIATAGGEQTLYTVSDAFLKVTDADSGAELASIAFD